MRLTVGNGEKSTEFGSREPVRYSHRIDVGAQGNLGYSGLEEIMSDDRVIDIRRYLDQSSTVENQGAFAVWGGDGERSRFALPLWRAIYLAGGDWGGVVSLETEVAGWTTDPGLRSNPLFILDLKSDPARTEAALSSLLALEGETSPALSWTDEGGVAVLLGEEKGKSWFLLVQGQDTLRKPEGKELETFLFLAGECSGLLFLRELSEL